MKLEPYLKDFEQECSCTLTVHDLGGVFVDKNGQSLIAQNRSSHRQRIEVCAKEKRDFCIKWCMNGVNKRVQKRHEPSYIKRCRNGVIEVVAPLIKDHIHVATLIAGTWGARKNPKHINLQPADPEKLQRLKRMLPLFGLGLLEHVAQTRFRPNKEFNRKAEIRDFVMQHASSQITLHDLADKLRLSPSRTCHLVKECFGKSFNILLAEERVERARQLLISTDYQMSEIAELIGLGSPEHFNRTFKRYTNLSPGKYRQRYRLILD